MDLLRAFSIHLLRNRNVSGLWQVLISLDRRGYFHGSLLLLRLLPAQLVQLLLRRNAPRLRRQRLPLSFI